MTDSENVARVRARLREINSKFDILMCLCTFVDEDETVPGSTSPKLDFIKGKDDFTHRVEAWLASVEMPEYGCCILQLYGIKNQPLFRNYNYIL